MKAVVPIYLVHNDPVVIVSRASEARHISVIGTLVYRHSRRETLLFGRDPENVTLERSVEEGVQSSYPYHECVDFVSSVVSGVKLICTTSRQEGLRFVQGAPFFCPFLLQVLSMACRYIVWACRTPLTGLKPEREHRRIQLSIVLGDEIRVAWAPVCRQPPHAQSRHDAGTGVDSQGNDGLGAQFDRQGQKRDRMRQRITASWFPRSIPKGGCERRQRF